MNTAKTTLLLGLLTGLLLFMGYALGRENGIAIALVMAVLMNFGAWFFSDKIVLAMYGAKPVTPEQAPELHGIVERLAMKAGIPMPKLYVIPGEPALNAFATGRGPGHAAVAATEGILRAMSREELEGVLAHELSHVVNRDTLVSCVAASIAGAISYMAHFAYFLPMDRRDDDDRGSNPLVALLALILTPIAAFFIQMAVSRSREYGADESGARLVGYPQGLISALRKLQAAAERIPFAAATPATAHLFIVNPFSGAGLMKLLSTHPPLEERIRRLQQLNP